MKHAAVWALLALALAGCAPQYIWRDRGACGPFNEPEELHEEGYEA